VSCSKLQCTIRAWHAHARPEARYLLLRWCVYVLLRDNRAQPCVLQCVAGCCSVVMEHGVRMFVLKPNGIYFVNSWCSASKRVAG